MARIDASRTVEIDAPLERVYEIAADVPGAERWRNQVVSIEVLETDAEGRATLVEEVTDAKVKKVMNRLRFSYDPPNEMGWEQEKGELKSVEGSWELEDLGGDRTRATYNLEVDLGRMLGMVIRGPMVDVLRGQLVNARAGELKKRGEGG